MNEAMRSMAWRPSGKTAAKNGHMWIISSHTSRSTATPAACAFLAKRVESSSSTSHVPTRICNGGRPFSSAYSGEASGVLVSPPAIYFCAYAVLL